MNQPNFVVTGASSGIGRAVAIELAQRGHYVAAVARSGGLLDDLGRQHAPNLVPVVADLATSSGLESVRSAVHGAAVIEGIVHAAGSLVPLEPYSDLSADELVAHFRIHVAAPVQLNQLLAADGRSISRMMFIDSYSASTPRVGWASYSTVKAAAQMAARCAAAELVDSRVIRVYPGAVNTPIVAAVLASDTPTAETFAAILERGEFVEPRQAAEFMVALLVDAEDGLLDTREVWDYNDSADRSAVGD